MRWSQKIGWAWFSMLTVVAAYSPAQRITPVSSRWLGLVDSRPGEVEIIPGVRVRGVEILGIVPGSPATRAGLNPGDVVLAAYSGRISSPDELRQALALSGPRMRLKIFEARTAQVLNVVVQFETNWPGIPLSAISVAGRLRCGVMAIGGETTGTTLTDEGGRIFDLEFDAGMSPGPQEDGRLAAVSGRLKAGPGTERTGRRVILVDYFRLLGERPAPKDHPRAMPF